MQIQNNVCHLHDFFSHIHGILSRHLHDISDELAWHVAHRTHGPVAEDPNTFVRVSAALALQCCHRFWAAKGGELGSEGLRELSRDDDL